MSEHLPVNLAWSAVMDDVRELGKGNRAHNFNFRGVDDVMNLFGPIFRKHKVFVTTNVRDLRTDTAQSQQGKLTQIVRVIVEYTVVGPAGDTFVGSSAGEANDVGDKATAKAMSVAFRTFMLQTACLPTQDTDPDMEGETLQAGPDWAGNYQAAKAQGPDTFRNFLGWARKHGGPEAMLKQGEEELGEMQ